MNDDDPLARLIQAATERRLRNTPVLIDKMQESNRELKKLMNGPSALWFQNLLKLNTWKKSVQEELEAASRYIAENEVIHLKVKKDIPTVIEYQGRRYILDHAENRKR
jgi:hypothetical protein